MALLPCKECGKQISDLAEACPGCGTKVQRPIDYYFDTRAFLIIALMLVVGWAVMRSI